MCFFLFDILQTRYDMTNVLNWCKCLFVHSSLVLNASLPLATSSPVVNPQVASLQQGTAYIISKNIKFFRWHKNFAKVLRKKFLRIILRRTLLFFVWLQRLYRLRQRRHVRQLSLAVAVTSVVSSSTRRSHSGWETRALTLTLLIK